MRDESSLQEKIRIIRAMTQASVDRVGTLRPVWSAFLVCETLNKLASAIDELEAELGAGSIAISNEMDCSREPLRGIK